MTENVDGERGRSKNKANRKEKEGEVGGLGKTERRKSVGQEERKVVAVKYFGGGKIWNYKERREKRHIGRR